MINVEFVDLSEIRMGSPYNVCKLHLSGSWIPDLPGTDWQDLQACWDGGTLVALVRWDTPGNRPGFRIWVLDGREKTVWTSDRYPGCCRNLEWLDRRSVAWEAFPDLNGICEVLPGRSAAFPAEENGEG